MTIPRTTVGGTWKDPVSLVDLELGGPPLRLHMLVFLLRLLLAEGKVLAVDVLGRVEQAVSLVQLS